MKKHLCMFAVLAAFGSVGATANEAASAAAKLDSMERTGEVVDCLPLRDVDQIYAVDDTTFLIKSGVGRYYVTETTGCTGATHWKSRIEHITQKNNMCRNDILRVIDNQSGALRGSCSVGSFEKLAKKAPA